MKVIEQLKFEPAYYSLTVQHVSHDTMDSPPVLARNTGYYCVKKEKKKKKKKGRQKFNGTSKI